VIRLWTLARALPAGKDAASLTGVRAPAYDLSMSKRKPRNGEVPTAAPAAAPPAPQRNRLEFIRFRTREDRRKALGIFGQDAPSDVYFTFSADFPENTCVTNTSTVRALRERGIPFEWLTENT
jgi:hypothetical protein